MASPLPSPRTLDASASDAAVQDLARALRLAEGSFSLLIATCNDPVWRDHSIAQLCDTFPGSLIARCSADTLDPLDVIPPSQGTPAALHVIQLELAVPGDESQLEPLRRLNLHRARWQRLGCPVVFWVPEYLLGLLLRRAPDFANWRSGTLRLSPPVQPGLGFTGASSQSKTIESPAASYDKGAGESADIRDARTAELLHRLRSQLPAAGNIVDATQAEWSRELSLLLARAGNITEAWHWHHLAMAWESEKPNASRLVGDWGRFGDALLQSGHSLEAQNAYTEAQAIAERLAASDATNAEWQRELSVSLNYLGNVAEAQGNLDEAKRHYTGYKAIAERLAASDPANAAWQRDLWMSNGKLGDLERAQGNFPEAMRLWTLANGITQRLATRAPANAAWQRDHSVSLEKLGNLAMAQGNLAGALHVFTESKAIRERLAASDPANAERQRDLSVSLNKVGDLAVAQGDLAGALRSFSKSKAIREHLAASDPANAVWQRDLSYSCWVIATKVFQPQQRWAEALELMEQALRISERLATTDPTNVMCQEDVQVSRALVAELRAKVAGKESGA